MSQVPVVYVIGLMGVGGAERHLLEVFAHLDRRRFAPILYCLTPRPDDAFIGDTRRLGVEVVDGGVADTLFGMALVRAVARLRTFLVARRAGIVHGYLFEANLIAALAGRAARVPVTLVSKRSLDAYHRRARRVACRVANRLADRVVANAEAVKAHVHRTERCALDRIVVIPNGIDVTRLSLDGPPPIATAGDGRLVGTVGRLSWKKGHADLLDAAALVLHDVPDARFALLGDGPLRGSLERRAASLGIASRVAFLGRRPDGPRILPCLDVFVLPSHIEGMSMSLIEAMAAGCPIAATDVGGNREVVLDGRTGLLVPPREPAQLAKAIVTLLCDRPAALAMAAAARARAAAEFTAETMVARLEALYAGLLRTKGVAVG